MYLHNIINVTASHDIYSNQNVGTLNINGERQSNIAIRTFKSIVSYVYDSEFNVHALHTWNT